MSGGGGGEWMQTDDRYREMVTFAKLSRHRMVTGKESTYENIVKSSQSIIPTL
jgi:hypothetical protein